MNGINFTKEMFHAVIDGSKIQTRRIVNPQPITVFKGIPIKEYNNQLGIKDITPRYKVGETLYLKEPYRVDSFGVEYNLDDKNKTLAKITKWRNKLFMPAKYARYFIEITAVRCERLQDISDEDCLNEGIFEKYYFEKTKYYENGVKIGKMQRVPHYNTPKQAYASLINSIYGKGTWESNPYVWVYEFKLLKNK